MSNVLQTQRDVCERFGASFLESADNLRVGVSRNVGSGLFPVNGLRHPPDSGTTGWFIWAGEELSSDPLFFESIHVSHLKERCPEVLPYLGLTPGWRFLLAPSYEDVWYDESLLKI